MVLYLGFFFFFIKNKICVSLKNFKKKTKKSATLHHFEQYVSNKRVP